MGLETIRTIAEIGTAVGTFLLAIATYHATRQTLKERKPNIEVRARPEDLGEEERSIPSIIFTALNKGLVSVPLVKFELWLENIHSIPVPFSKLGEARYGSEAFEGVVVALEGNLKFL